MTLAVEFMLDVVKLLLLCGIALLLVFCIVAGCIQIYFVLTGKQEDEQSSPPSGGSRINPDCDACLIKNREEKDSNYDA